MFDRISSFVLLQALGQITLILNVTLLSVMSWRSSPRICLDVQYNAIDWIITEYCMVHVSSVKAHTVALQAKMAAEISIVVVM